MNKYSDFRATSTGSYLALYFASCIMNAAFLLVFAWHLLTRSFYFDMLVEQYTSLAYVLIVWVCLGWLMALVAAIGFDILPLIHGSSPFEETTMRQFWILNVTGQTVLIFSTFMKSLEGIEEFSTVGIVLLSLGVILLGVPGRRLYQESKRKKNNDEVGIMSLIPGLIFPFFGGTIIVCWLLRDTMGVLELGRSIMIMLYLLITVAMIVSHFNRRLNWNIIEPSKIPLRFGIFFVFLGLHILFSFLAAREASETLTLLGLMKNYSLGMAFLSAFFVCNPLGVAKKAFMHGGMAHNRLVFAALWTLPFCSFHAFNSAQYSERIGIPGYATFLSTTAILAVWGYAIYLHEDHLHINIHKRRSNFLFMAIFSIGFIAIQVLFVKTWMDWGSTALEERIWFWLIPVASAMIVVKILRQTVLSLDTWHKIPMFYGRYLQEKSHE